MKCVVAAALILASSVAARADCLATGRKLDGAARHADAIAAWKACLTPGDAAVEGEIAAAAFQLHDLDTAQKFAVAATEHAKDPSTKAAALFTLGRAQEAGKNIPGAIASYTASLALRPNAAVQARLAALDPKGEVASGVPPAFAKIVVARAADLAMRVDGWWQDDLDGDGKPEQIAALCKDEGADGVYLIEHQGAMLVARRTNMGRETCEANPKPSWHIEHTGFINHSYSVHRASMFMHIAVRDHHAVRIYDGEDGADGGFDLDWEALTISDHFDGNAPGVPDRVIAISDAAPRWTTLGKVALSATIAGDKVTLHVKSAPQVQVSLCSAFNDKRACDKTLTKPVKGAADIVVPDGENARVPGSRMFVELEMAGVRSHAIMMRDGDMIAGYPSAEVPDN